MLDTHYNKRSMPTLIHLMDMQLMNNVLHLIHYMYNTRCMPPKDNSKAIISNELGFHIIYSIPAYKLQLGQLLAPSVNYSNRPRSGFCA